jgi:hypothetical protein
LTNDDNVMDIAPMDIPAQSLSFGKPVKASTAPNLRWRGAGSVNNGDWVGNTGLRIKAMNLHGWKLIWKGLERYQPLFFSKAVTRSLSLKYNASRVEGGKRLTRAIRSKMASQWSFLKS